MGRAKIDATQELESESKKRSTFKQRGAGLQKKFDEMGILCGVQGLLIVHGPQGELIDSCSNTSMRELYKRYIESKYKHMLPLPDAHSIQVAIAKRKGHVQGSEKDQLDAEFADYMDRIPLQVSMSPVTAEELKTFHEEHIGLLKEATDANLEAIRHFREQLQITRTASQIVEEDGMDQLDAEFADHLDRIPKEESMSPVMAEELETCHEEHIDLMREATDANLEALRDYREQLQIARTASQIVEEDGMDHGLQTTDVPPGIDSTSMIQVSAVDASMQEIQGELQADEEQDDGLEDEQMLQNQSTPGVDVESQLMNDIYTPMSAEPDQLLVDNMFHTQFFGFDTNELLSFNTAVHVETPEWQLEQKNW